MKRKLGARNGVSFSIIILLFIAIIAVFAYFINYEMKKEDNTYEVASGSILFNYKNDYIEMKNGGVIKKGFDRNYYLNYVDENDVQYKQKIGQSTIVYKEGDYKLYLYGNAYRISTSGEVEKVTDQTEIIKSGSPYFFKISDRKYLFVDKKLGTADGSIKTTDYLLIELDKQGNATFINFENNVKTIKPLVLKGTVYDFDIANEKLIIGKDKEIDLKTIIGSSNAYVKKEETKDDKDDNKDTNNKNESSYYDEYLSTIKNSFNNLVGSINGINENLQGEISKEEAYLDLTRWTALKQVKTNINSLELNYAVFDPNNEYSEVFIILTYGEQVNKIQLSKSNDVYTIPNLLPDTEYQLQYGYRLVSGVGDSTTDVIIDNIKVKTKALHYQVLITKITTNRIYYTVIFNNGCIPNSCRITFYTGDNEISNQQINRNMIDRLGMYSGYFEYTTLDYVNVLKLSDVTFDNILVDYTVTNKFIN